MTPAQRRLLDRGSPLVDGIVGRQEQALKAVYESSYSDIRRELENLYMRYTSGEKMGRSTWVRGRRLLDMADSIGKELHRITGVASTGLDAALVETFKGGAGLVQFVIDKGVGVALDMGTIDPDIIRATLNHRIEGVKYPERMTLAEAQANARIKAVLAQGELEGWHYTRMARELGKMLDTSFTQNVRIMRTEGHRVHQQARNEAWNRAKAAGVKLTRIWRATLDDRTRDTHQTMDGQLEDANGFFISSTGNRTQLPGGFGIPEEDINCRCTTGAQVYGLSPSTRFARDADGESIKVPGGMTYREWAEQYNPSMKSPALGNIG